MTTIQDAPRYASPVDYEAYGEYGPGRGFERGQSFQRPRYRFQGRITADGSSGYQAEPGRYHLYISHTRPALAGARSVTEGLSLRTGMASPFMSQETLKATTAMASNQNSEGTSCLMDAGTKFATNATSMLAAIKPAQIR